MKVWSLPIKKKISFAILSIVSLLFSHNRHNTKIKVKVFGKKEKIGHFSSTNEQSTNTGECTPRKSLATVRWLPELNANDISLLSGLATEIVTKFVKVAMDFYVITICINRGYEEFNNGMHSVGILGFANSSKKLIYMGRKINKILYQLLICFSDEITFHI